MSGGLVGSVIPVHGHAWSWRLILRFESFIGRSLLRWLMEGVKVSVEDDEIVVLLHEFLQPEMLSAKAKKHVAGSIVPHFLGPRAFVSQHQVKKCFSMAASLNGFMHVEVQDA